MKGAKMKKLSDIKNDFENIYKSNDMRYEIWEFISKSIKESLNEIIPMMFHFKELIYANFETPKEVL
jgi:hypothetical protein